MITPRAEELFNVAHAAATSMNSMWADWLVHIGYGVDWYTLDFLPPCSLIELAEAYERRYAQDPIGQGMTVEDWMECIEANSGKW